jgi:O-antigen/teichoic acid export membrane protein
MKTNPNSELARVLVSNAAVNLLGQALLLGITFFSTPYIANSFGPSKYGLVVLLSSYVELFALMNLGVNMGLLKYVSELLPQGEFAEIQCFFGTGLTLFLAGGLLIGIAGTTLASLIVRHLMNVPPAAQSEVVLAFHVATAAFVLRFVSQPFSAIPAAVQRFDIYNLIHVGAEVVRIAGWVLALYCGYSLVAIFLVTLATNLLLLAANIVASRVLIPGLPVWPRFSLQHFRTLFHYSKYVTVAQVSGRLVNSSDVAILGKFQPASAVAFYGIPYTIGYRVWVVLGNIAGAVFPAASGLFGERRLESLQELYLRATKIVAGMGLFLTFLFALFAREILFYWIGPVFAAEGTLAFRLLIVAFGVSSLQHIPNTVLGSIGRVDYTAKFAVIYAVCNIVLLCAFIPHFGVNGAAFGFLLTQFVTVPWVAHTCNRFIGLKAKVVAARSFGRALPVCALSIGVAAFTKPWVSSLLSLLAVFAMAGIFHLALSLVVILDHTDRAACWSVLRKLQPIRSAECPAPVARDTECL